MITTTLTELGNGKLPPLPDSDQNFELRFHRNNTEHPELALQFEPCHPFQVLHAYGKADTNLGRTFLFGIEIYDFSNRGNAPIGKGIENLDYAYSSGWQPEIGDYFWTILNRVQDPMYVGTTATYISALAELLRVLDKKHLVED